MWQLLFWGSVAVIAYSYFGYPALLYLLGRLKISAPSPPDRPAPDVPVPRVCLVISAYNEEAVIREKIENSLSLQYPRLTVLVASDGSMDATDDITREYAGRGVELMDWAERRGKSAVLNDVIAAIDHDVVVFTDANAAFAPDAIEKLVARFLDPDIGCVVGKLRYVEKGSTSVGKGEGVYWRYEAMISILESRLKSVLVANGSIFAIRRELFRDLSPDVANDFQTAMDIGGQGWGVVYEAAACADEHTTTYWQEEFDRKVRIILRGLTGYAIMRSGIRGRRLWQFWSHKMLRWMAGFFLFSAFGANIVIAEASLFYTMTLAVQLAFYFAALRGWMTKGTGRPNSAFYVPFYFTMVNASAAIAVVRFLFGHRQRVWDTAKSTRTQPVRPVAERQTENKASQDVGEKVAKN